MADDQGAMPWHMSGNWTPRLDEQTASPLEVEGEIPASLNGTYIRTGPNPKTATPHWFLGDGMVHGVRLRDGEAEWYRNAFVQTESLKAGVQEAGAPRGLSDSKANTHILPHNGKILALNESGWPWVIDQDLATVGVENYGGALTCAMTAHPKVCPETGELLAFSYFQFEPPFMRYIRIGADGEVKQIEPIDLPNMVMMHDFAITRNYAIFLDLPLVFDLELLASGIPFGFKREAGARIGVMPREGGNEDVRWFEIDPCYIFHTVNAHEAGGKIILTASRLASAFDGGSDEYSDVGYLCRWTIDLAAGAVKEERLDDRPGDFGRVNEAKVGLPARYGYLMAMAGEGVSDEPIYGSQLLKYDLETGACKAHELGQGVRGGEPVFVQDGPGEDDGYVMTFCRDEGAGQSKFVILDSRDFDGPPVAIIRLPHRVPYGAHGSWVPLS